jgi:NADH-quinone oxidoreductase subunit L
VAEAQPLAAHGAEAATGAAAEHGAHDLTTERVFTGISVAIAFLGIALGWVFFTANPLRRMPKLLEDKYYVDEAYNKVFVNPVLTGSRNVLWRVLDVKIIDGTVNGVAQLFSGAGGAMRVLQSGFARSYAAIMLVGAIILIIYFTFR